MDWITYMEICIWEGPKLKYGKVQYSLLHSSAIAHVQNKMTASMAAFFVTHFVWPHWPANPPGRPRAR